MKTYRSTLRTMKLIIFVCQLVLILRTDAQIPAPCIVSDTNRPPANSDITVVCGTEYMDLSIYLCPVYQALYNESLLVLNNQLTRPQCFGTADWSVTPPVVKFRIPINETSISSCSNIFQIITETGTGAFADFSNVQFVNISGTVNTIDPSAGMITYRPQVLYKFSCRYPMHYLINNTQLAVSGVNIAIKDNNGSFISTLSMQLYQDALYQQTLTVPQTGLNLKTKIYVLVKATNLTDKFNILLDRCYTTTTPQPFVKSYYDLFVGCNRDSQTKVEINGVSRVAQFSFEAFRFVEHKNLSVSTFYLHCVTRLCEVSTCGSLLPSCVGQRRTKREVGDALANTTVTSPIIIVGKQSSEEAQMYMASQNKGVASADYSSPVVAIIICIVILAILIIAMGSYFMLYLRRRKPIMQ